MVEKVNVQLQRMGQDLKDVIEQMAASGSNEDTEVRYHKLLRYSMLMQTPSAGLTGIQVK